MYGKKENFNLHFQGSNIDPRRVNMLYIRGLLKEMMENVSVHPEKSDFSLLLLKAQKEEDDS